MSVLLIPLLVLQPGRSQVPSEFYSYLKQPDSSYIEQSTTDSAGITIDLTSQTWQGITWKHKILFRSPKNVKTKGIAVLYITGDGPNPADYADLALIGALADIPVATLFNIPNQPLWDKKEDDLIAFTFEKYLETKDPTWPLLFPMAKSAERAMDAIEAATATTDNPIHKFVVTGASKRGWTTWFVGAAQDKRVIGIAPMVIDNLDVVKQMPHQLESWGKYSEEIEEYTKLGLQAKLTTPEGQQLARMVDPYYYLPNIKMPTLIVTATNDPYWTVDAERQYWDDLKMPHWASIVPNAAHDLGSKIQAIQAVAGFAHALSGEFKMPSLDWKLSEGEVRDGKRSLTLTASSSEAFRSVRVLTATSADLDFRPSKWSPSVELRVSDQGARTGKVVFAIPADQNVAVLAEVQFQLGGRTFTLSRPVSVFKKVSAVR